MAKRKVRGLCPVGPEFQKLVSNPNIGRIEAYRDWMENNYTVRTEEEVLAKLKDRGIYEEFHPKMGTRYPISERQRFSLNMRERAAVNEAMDKFQLYPGEARWQVETRTLDSVSSFLENIGVPVRLVPEIISPDGNPMEDALAVANFMDMTVDVVDDMKKRPEAWNSLPEEAAHWWYRLLKHNDPLKKQLWDNYNTRLKVEELKQTKYANINSPNDLTEEAIGQLIAQAIRRIEQKTADKKDYTFLEKFIDFLSEMLMAFQNIFKSTIPYEVAAMKILSSDMRNLMTLNQYKRLEDDINFVNTTSVDSVGFLEPGVLDKYGKFYVQLDNSEFITGGASYLLEELKYGRDPSVLTNTSGKVYFQAKSDESLPYGTPQYEQAKVFWKTPAFEFDNSSVTDVNRVFDNITKAQDAAKVWMFQNIRELAIDQKEALVERIEVNDFFDKLQGGKYRKRSKFLKKAIANSYTIEPVGSQKTEYLGFDPAEIGIRSKTASKKLSPAEIRDLKQRYNLYYVTPTLKVLPDLLKHYTKANIQVVLSEPVVKVAGAKDKEMKVLNAVRELIQKDNPGLKKISIEDFLNEVHNWLRMNYEMGLTDEDFHNGYRTGNTFSFKDNSVKHRKINLRFDNTYFDKHIIQRDFSTGLHGTHVSTAWGNLTPFYTSSSISKPDAVLMHEIQSDMIEYLEWIIEMLNNQNTDPTSINNFVRFYVDNQKKVFEKTVDKINRGDKNMLIWETNLPKSGLSRLYQQISGGSGYKIFGSLAYNDLSKFIQGLVVDAAMINDNKFLEAIRSEQDIKDDFYNTVNDFKTRLEEQDNLIDENAINANIIKLEKYISIEYTSIQRAKDALSRGGMTYLLGEEYMNKIKSTIKSINQDDNLTFDQKKEQLFIRMNWAKGINSIGYGEVDDNINEPLSKTVAEKIKEIYGIAAGGRDSMAQFVGNVFTNAMFLKAQPRTNRTKLNENVEWFMNKALNMYVLNRQSTLNEHKKKIYGNYQQINTKRNYKLIGKLNNKQLLTLANTYAENLELFYNTAQEAANRELEAAGGARFTEQEINELLDKNQKIFDKITQMAPSKVTKALEKGGRVGMDEAKKLQIMEDYLVPLIHELIRTHIRDYGKNVPLFYSGFDITLSTQGNPKTAALYAGPDEVAPGMTPEKAKEIRYNVGLSMRLYTADTPIDEGIKKLNAYRTGQDIPLAERGKRGYEINRRDQTVFNNIMQQTGSRPISSGFMYNVLSKISGIKLRYQPSISGLLDNNSNDGAGGYFIDLTNYAYEGSVEEASKPNWARGPFLYSIGQTPQQKAEEITQDDNSYYRGQIEEPTIDKDGNLILYGRKDDLYERAGLPSMGVSMTDDLQSAVEYGNGQLEVAQNLASETYDSDRELDRLSEKGYYLIQIPKNISNEIVKEAGEVKVIGNKIIIPKGQYKIQQVSEYIEEPISQVRMRDVDTPAAPIDVVNKTILTESPPMDFSQSSDTTTKGVRLVNAMAESFSDRMGVPYEIITAQEALDMLASADRKWNGHPAFVFNDTVYFIEGMMTPDIVLHEFAHPLIKGIFNSNPDLFYKLYNDLKSTDEGRRVIQEVSKRNQDLDYESDAFMEEALVRALELKSTLSKTGKGMSKKFMDYVNELLFQFKRFLRSFVKAVDPKSKIDVSKLNENTTLNELSDMLLGTKAFKFKEVKQETEKTKLTKQVDFYSYIRDQSEEIMSLNTVAPRDLMDMATQGIKAVSKNLRMIKNRRNKEEMFETLKDEMGLSNLEEIRSNLMPYTDYMERRLGDIVDEIDYNQKHVEALVNTYFRLSKTMKKVTKHLKEITKDVDNPENLARAHSYMSLVNTWKNFIDYTLDVFRDNNIPTDNKMSTLVSGIRNEIQNAEKEISTIKANGVRDTFYNHLMDINESGQRRFDEIIAHYKKYNYKQYMTDRAYVEWYGMTQAEWMEFQKMEDTGAIQGRKYQELKEKSLKGAYITKEKIELTLSGQMNDVHWMNSYFEGYLYNDDPIVASLSLFVKKGLDDAMIKSQAMYNDFLTELAPLIENTGYGPNSMSEFGKRVGFIDSFGTNINGEFTEFKVWTLLNKWQGDRIAVDKMKHEISEARLQWYRTNSDKDKEKLIELINQKEQHDVMYMHQQYVPEYYTVRSTFTAGGTNKTAVNALMMRDDLLKKIRNLQEKIPTDQDMFQVPEQIKQAWDEYKQLHSLTDANGKPKTGDDLAMTKELLRFREMSRKFYEYNIIPGAFENALFKYEQKLINQGYRDDDYTKARRRWIEENTRVYVLPEFWKARRDLVDELKQILTSKAMDPQVSKEQARLANEISEAYTKLFDATAGFRDEDGQPEALSMSNNKLQLVKDQQELIEKLRDDVVGYSGLSRNDQARLRELDEKERLTESEENEINELYNKKENTYTKEQRKRIRAIFRELGRLSSNEPTDYYQVAFNNILRSIEADPNNAEIINRIRNYYGSTELSKSQLNGILEPDIETRIILTELMNIKEFKEWFDRSHTSKVEKDFNEPGNEMVVKYKRTYVWSVIRPNDSEFYKGYEIKDENGRVVEKIDRIPNLRFYKRDVKKEFWTGYNPLTGEVNLEVGVHVDNKMRFLPREDVVNSPYMNKAYYELKDKEPALFKALEALTKWSLKIQDGLDNASRNYLDFPRFEQSRIEFARNNNVLKKKTSAFKATIKRIKNFFLGNKETAPESKGQWSDDYRVAQLDIFDEDEEYHAPIHGLYNLPPEEVSTEITSSLLRYMVSANKNKALTEMYPAAKALKDVLDGNGMGKLKKLTKRHLTGDGETVSSNSDQNEIRRQVVSNFIDREFYGQTVTGPGKDSVELHAISQNMFQMASLGFFGFNIDSAVKNAIGQKIQGTIEAIAGRYYNMRDLALGEGWAFKTMGELSFQIYSTAPKSHNVQLWEVFDPTSDHKKKAAREGMTRTFMKDLSEPSGIAMNFRKWTEIQSMMQIWSAMMYNTKVEQNGKMIDWIDAWETKDGKIRLKEGVDPEWGITYDAEGNQIIGSKFKNKRQQMQSVLIKLQGAYDDFNQPEAQRYLVMKFISFMRRYFVPMLIDRFGFKWKNGSAQARMQIGLNEYTEGTYITLMRHLKDTLFHGPKRLMTATPDERRAWLKTTADFAILTLFIVLEGMLFGWHDDDEDRFEKLREKSGPLPGPFIAEDEYKFNLSGFLHNKSLNMMMQVRAEQQQFIPLPGFGLRNYSEMIDQLGTSAAFSPTIGTAFSLFQDVANLATGSEKAYYQREVGPYLWQQEGGSKFITHLAKSIGLTGTFYQSELGIKKLESIEQGFAGGK